MGGFSAQKLAQVAVSLLKVVHIDPERVGICLLLVVLSNEFLVLLAEKLALLFGLLEALLKLAVAKFQAFVLDFAQSELLDELVIVLFGFL